MLDGSGWLVLHLGWYTLYMRLCEPQSRIGRVWKISPPPGSDPRTVHSLQRVAVPIEVTRDAQNATPRGNAILQLTDTVFYSLRKCRYIPEKFIVASRVLMMADAPVVATPKSRSLSPNSSPNDGSMERVASCKEYSRIAEHCFPLKCDTMQSLVQLPVFY